MVPPCGRERIAARLRLEHLHVVIKKAVCVTTGVPGTTMRIIKAKVQKYRSIRDSGWFDVEDGKTIFVGPNEAGKTALLKALQQLNAPEGVDGFDALRDYPRSELNDLDSGRVKAAETTVVQAISH